MASWIAFIGCQPSSIAPGIDRIRRGFSIGAVPPLRIEERWRDQRDALFGLSWSAARVPDLATKTSGLVKVMLAGVVTGVASPSGGSGSDPVAFLKESWQRQGNRSLNGLNGSFSVLIQSGSSVTLAVDRFASRPVCFSRKGSGWVAADSPLLVAMALGEEPRIDPASLWSYLHLGRRLGRDTIFSRVTHLLAGEALRLNAEGTEEISRWWQRRYDPDHCIPAREWGARIAAGLRLSARRYQTTCLSPYLFLSGGLDSRLAAAAFEPGLKTLTLCTRRNAETKAAARVANALHHPHCVVERSPHWYLETADAATLASGGDHLDHHAHFIAPVRDALAADPHGEFLLGDLLENFSKHYFSVPGGIPFEYSPEFFRDRLPLCLPSTVKDPVRLGAHLQPGFRASALQAYRSRVWDAAESLMKVSDSDADRLDCFLRWADVGLTYTYNMLTCIRSLAPERNLYFDNDLDDLALRIPAVLRGAGTLHRWTLWHLNPRLALIPEANTFLPPVLPRSLGRAARKVRPLLGRIRRFRAGRSGLPALATSGSWLLKHEMYRKDPAYRGWIEALLADRDSFPEEVFDRKQIRTTWEHYLGGDISRHFELEGLLSFANLRRLLLGRRSSTAT